MMTQRVGEICYGLNGDTIQVAKKMTEDSRDNSNCEQSSQ